MTTLTPLYDIVVPARCGNDVLELHGDLYVTVDKFTSDYCVSVHEVEPDGVLDDSTVIASALCIDALDITRFLSEHLDEVDINAVLDTI